MFGIKGARLRQRLAALPWWVCAIAIVAIVVLIVLLWRWLLTPAWVWPVYVFNIEPYYHRCDAKYKQDVDGITVVTQLSANRLSRLATMTLAYDGPLSAAVYVRYSRDLDDIRSFLSSDGACAQCDNLDLHVVHTDGGLYPINSLRNIARRMVNTSRILVLDVDFVPSSGAHDLSAPPRGAGEVMALPAFELLDGSKKSPSSKKELIDYISKGWAQPVNNQSWPIGHRACDYPRWNDAVKPYEARYHYPFEPYYIAWMDEVPEYDERFRGYGEDKAQQCHHVFRMGHKFMIHHEHFVVHMPHEFDTGGWESEVRPMVRYNPLNAFFRDMQEKYGPAPKKVTEETDGLH